MNRSKSRAPAGSPLPQFFFDRRDRRPGTHFALELGAPKPAPADPDPHVDEDLGCSEFGIELPFLRRD